MQQKIVFVTRGLHDGGGIERVTSYIASLLAQEGWKVDILCLQKRGEPYFPLSEKVNVVYQSEYKGWSRTKRIRNYYKEVQPDLIIGVGSNRSLTHYFSAKGFKFATWEHFNTTIQAHPLHSFSRWWATRLGWIITLTPADAEAYRQCYKTQKVISIANPITIDNLQPTDLSAKRVLSAGRLVGQKGFDRLLQAWSLVEGKHPDWQLRIVGSGKKELLLKEQIRRLGLEDRVEMLPHSKNMTEQYRQASIYAMASRYEGFPLVLLEAMASALPIVSFDCPRGPSDIITPQETGILVPDNDIEAFAQALDSLMIDAHLRHSMSQKALEKSIRYTPQHILKEWTQALQKLTL